MKNNKRGLTLAEILISTAIFALIVVGVTGTFIISVDTSRKINYEYTATNIAKSRIERLKYMDFDLLSDEAETDVNVDENGVPLESGEYVRNTIVTTNYDGNSHLTKVKAEVYYIYRGSKNANPATMTALLTDVN